MIRRIDVVPKSIHWADSGEMVVIACESSFFVLRYNKSVVESCNSTQQEESSQNEEQGIDGAFDVLLEVSERVVTASWIGDCFVYTNSENRLNYTIGSEIVTISHLDKKMYLLVN